MNVNIIIPFSKPAHKATVVNNLMRQTRKADRVVVVENGCDVWSNGEYGADVITSAKHQSKARNAGIDYLLSMGETFAFCWDCDDYYANDYLEVAVREVLALRDRYGSKPILYGRNLDTVRDTQGIFTISPIAEHCEVDWVYGGTHSFDLSPTLKYPILDEGEDNVFCTIARKRGYVVYAGSKGGTIYDRTGIDHAWRKDARKFFAQTHNIQEIVT
jgi:glycosyltransferase involved in cell wall biosynthesis